MKFLLLGWGLPDRFANLGKNLKIAPSKNPGILKVKVEKDCRGKKLRKYLRQRKVRGAINIFTLSRYISQGHDKK